MTIFLSLATFCSAVSAVSKWGLVDNFMCFVFKTSVISNNCPWFTSLFYRFLFHFEISVSVTSLPDYRKCCSFPSHFHDPCIFQFSIFYIHMFPSVLFMHDFLALSWTLTFAWPSLVCLPRCQPADPCMTSAFSYSFVFETLFCFPASYVSVSSCKCEKLLLEI